MTNRSLSFRVFRDARDPYGGTVHEVWRFGRHRAKARSKQAAFWRPNRQVGKSRSRPAPDGSRMVQTVSKSMHPAASN